MDDSFWSSLYSAHQNDKLQDHAKLWALTFWFSSWQWEICYTDLDTAVQLLRISVALVVAQD